MADAELPDREKAKTKRVGRPGKAKRAGGGGSLARVRSLRKSLPSCGLKEDGFRPAVESSTGRLFGEAGFLGTDGFPPLQGDACGSML